MAEAREALPASPRKAGALTSKLKQTKMESENRQFLVCQICSNKGQTAFQCWEQCNHPFQIDGVPTRVTGSTSHHIPPHPTEPIDDALGPQLGCPLYSWLTMSESLQPNSNHLFLRLPLYLPFLDRFPKLLIFLRKSIVV